MNPDHMRYRFGWEIDCFDSDHECAFVDDYDLADMGISNSFKPRPPDVPSVVVIALPRPYYNHTRIVTDDKKPILVIKLNTAIAQSRGEKLLCLT